MLAFHSAENVFFCICICICICIALCVEVDLMRWVLLVMTGLPPLGQTACLLSENSTAEEENQKSQPTRSLKSDPRTSFPSCNQGCLGSHVLCCSIQTKEVEFFTSKGVVLDRVQYFSDLFYVQPLMLFCLVAIRYLVARCYISVLCGFLE